MGNMTVSIAIYIKFVPRKIRSWVVVRLGKLGLKSIDLVPKTIDKEANTLKMKKSRHLK